MPHNMYSPLSFITLIPEHRKGNHLIYPIDYLMLIAFCSTLCSFSPWHGIELYAKTYEKDLAKLYHKITGKRLRRYTPSHDTFCTALQSMNPKTFQDAFTRWLTEVFEILGHPICIDGKTMRGVKKILPRWAILLRDDCH